MDNQNSNAAMLDEEVIVINIDDEGRASFIWNDELASMKTHGDTKIRRVSYVEPEDDKFTADLSPVGGPKFGPFNTHKEAIDAELGWLKENIFVP